MSKRIAVITGSRAEYGILVSVLDAIEARDDLELALIVTGTHLTTGSLKDITQPIAARVKMQRTGALASRMEDVQSLGRGVMAIGRVLGEIQPDVVVVLGDRIEAMAGALAASVGGTRVAHIHGGDRAEGVADEAMRHAISKLSHLHFAATTTSRKRLIRMGEVDANVYRTGSPAIDGIKKIEPFDESPDLVIMQHPVGTDSETEYQWMETTLKATEKHSRIVLSPNHDPGRDAVMRAIVDAKLKPTEHLPRRAFLSLLKGAKVLVGNSSAGLIEAAALKKPVVNLGDRQAGRERPGNVIDAPHKVTAIRKAVNEALEMKTKGMRQPYGNGKAGEKIADLLATIDLSKVELHKHNAY